MVKESFDQPQRFSPKEFLQQIENFSWQDFKDDDKLRKFIRASAQAYLALTGSSRLTVDDLSRRENVEFFRIHKDYLAALKKYGLEETNDDFTVIIDQKKILMDLTRVAQKEMKERSAGVVLVEPLFNEFLHLDISPRTAAWPSDIPLTDQDGVSHIPVSYSGVRMTDSNNNYSLVHFEEILIDSLATLLVIRDLGLREMPVSAYFARGVNKLLPYIISLGMDSAELYRLYSSSDLENLAVRLGEKIDGSGSAFEKGFDLFNAFDTEDPQLLNALQIDG